MIALEAEVLHWRELPQVSFASLQKFCHDKPVFVVTNNKQVFVMTKQFFCCDKNMHVVTKCDKNIFVVTNSFVATKLLYACHDKTFVATNTCFVVTNICHDKSFVATKIFCLDKHNFVATKVLLQQV